MSPGSPGVEAEGSMEEVKKVAAAGIRVHGADGDGSRTLCGLEAKGPKSGDVDCRLCLRVLAVRERERAGGINDTEN